MADGTSKLQLLIELKDKLSAGLDSVKKKVEKSVGSIQSKLGEFKAKNIEAFNAIKSEVPGLGRAVELLKNPYVAAAAAVVALGMAYAQCVNMALDWQSGMAKINVTAQLSQKELGKLSDRLIDIGERNVAPIEQIPDAFNQIISAGLDVNTSLKVLEPTLRAAKAGFTDVKTVADAAVGVMNSSGRDINRVYDVLFATMNKGKAEFQDIAHYLPKIIPSARGAGLALEETAGAWAYFTAHGFSAEQATTGMQNLIKSLSSSDIAIGSLNKKTGQYTGGLPSLGVKVFDAAGKMRSLKAIAGDLTGAMQGLTDKQKMLKLEQAGITDVEAKGAMLSMIQDYDNLSKTIDFVTNSQGQLDEAYRNSLTPLDHWHVLQNLIKGEMIKLGQLALPIINSIGEKLLGVINYFKDLYKNSSLFRDMLAWIGTSFEISFKMAIVPIMQIVNLFKNAAWAISELVSKIPGVGGGIEDLYRKVRPVFMYIKELVGQVADIMYKIITFDFKGAVSAWRNFKMPDMETIKKKLEIEYTKTKTDELKTDTGTGTSNPPKQPPVKTGTDTAKTITSGSQNKNITINIDSFIKGFNPQHQSINGMNKEELERWMTEMFLRVVRSAELSL